MSQYAEEIGFAAGTLIATQVGLSSVVTPIKFGILQDISLDFSADLKELYGQNRYAIALAPGKTKVEIKAKFAGIKGALFNGLYFGATPTATQTLFAGSEAHSVPAASPFTVTVANAAAFLMDEGVYYAATGLPLQQVAALTAAGQYTVNAATGVYTFYSADEGAAVYVSYTYGNTGGLYIPLTNIAMGSGPSFKVMLNQAYDGRQQTFIFNQCQASKLSFPTKQDDFTIAELDFMVSADIAGNIGSISTSL
jgi:hypothetical protein